MRAMTALIWVVPMCVLGKEPDFSPPPPPPTAQPVAAAPSTTFTPEAMARYQDAVAKVQAGAHGPATEVLNSLAAEYPRIPEIFASRCSAQLGLQHFAAAEADCAYALRVRPQMPAA